MIQKEIVNECFKNLLGWKNHFDTEEISELNEELTSSLTKEYYNEKHPALRLDYILQSLPRNQELEIYLKTAVETSVDVMVNDFINYYKLNNGNGLFYETAPLIQSSGWRNDTVINEGRFVGMCVKLKGRNGVKVSINKIGLQLTDAQTDLKIYVYNKSKKEAVKTYDFKKGGLNGFDYIESDIHILEKDLNGLNGEFYIGYYQNDLIGNAINYKNLDFNTGYCGVCDGGVKNAIYKKLINNAECFPFYVPNGEEIKNEGFDVENVIFTNNVNFGMNIEVTASCDLSYFICQQKFNFKELLYLNVAKKILKDILYSSEVNRIEENLKVLIIRDLEGDKETKSLSLNEQYEKALKVLNIDYAGVYAPCLPCKEDPYKYKAVK